MAGLPCGALALGTTGSLTIRIIRALPAGPCGTVSRLGVWEVQLSLAAPLRPGEVEGGSGRRPDKGGAGLWTSGDMVEGVGGRRFRPRHKA